MLEWGRTFRTVVKMTRSMGAVLRFTGSMGGICIILTLRIKLSMKSSLMV